ncbi:polyprenyl synthetase family protein [Streptomyces sp. NPDC001591]|uniref:polyprenyl synthetase family protein n=1 Tax=Streptomyces sp. NPDC001591 TaxID=3364589 RepID=UPI0036A8631E
MTETCVLSTAPGLDLDPVRSRIETVLGGFLAEQLQAPQAGLREMAEVLRDFIAAGGKRLRPLLCVLGWHTGAGSGPAPEPVLRAAASLEMFHAFALVHDDVMDDSDRRRGRPAVHRAMAARWPGLDQRAARRMGTAVAILVGDLALAWSDTLLHTAGLLPEQQAAVLPLIDVMRTELVGGQFLDLTAAARPAGGVQAALETARYKTAKYTFERPLHIGAALAGAPGGLHEALSAYAVPTGEAFQLRDDVLGVFGDPRLTGKPVLDDLREGKPTVLLAVARARATEQQRALLNRLVGWKDLDETGAEEARRVLIGTGAADVVETMIRERHRRALAALETAPVSPAIRATMRALADNSAWRDA